MCVCVCHTRCRKQPAKLWSMSLLSSRLLGLQKRPAWALSLAFCVTGLHRALGVSAWAWGHCLDPATTRFCWHKNFARNNCKHHTCYLRTHFHEMRSFCLSFGIRIAMGSTRITCKTLASTPQTLANSRTRPQIQISCIFFVSASSNLQLSAGNAQFLIETIRGCLLAKRLIVAKAKKMAASRCISKKGDEITCHSVPLPFWLSSSSRGPSVKNHPASNRGTLYHTLSLEWSGRITEFLGTPLMDN